MASLPYALPSWDPSDPMLEFWISRTGSNIIEHRIAVTAAAETDAYIRLTALTYGLITVKAALSMPGGTTALFQDSYGCFARYEPYFMHAFRALDGDRPNPDKTHTIKDLEAFGEYLLDHPALPWINGAADYADGNASRRSGPDKSTTPLDDLSRTGYLGAAAMTAILSESGHKYFRSPFGAIPELVPYQTFRQGAARRAKRQCDVNELPELPVPYEFEQIFRKWAALKVTVTGEQAEPQLLRDLTVIG
jgi:hypothetical protein